jgi:hypothetical protein
MVKALRHQKNGFGAFDFDRRRAAPARQLM